MSPKSGSKQKHNNKKPVIDGIKFDSQAEGARWLVLRQQEKIGKIKDLQRQVSFDVVVNGFKVCKYTADFVYMAGGKQIVEDFKGMVDNRFKLVYKMVYAALGIKILITQAVYKQKNNVKFIAGFVEKELRLPKEVKKGKKKK